MKYFAFEISHELTATLLHSAAAVLSLPVFPVCGHVQTRWSDLQWSVAIVSKVEDSPISVSVSGTLRTKKSHAVVLIKLDRKDLNNLERIYLKMKPNLKSVYPI